MGKEHDQYMKQLELQRQAFEAQFGSLESMGFSDKVKDTVEAESESENEVESESVSADGSEDEEMQSSSEGGSDDESDSEGNVMHLVKSQHTKPRVIKFSGPSDTYIEPSKKELKLIRSGKTLTQISRAELKKQELEEKQQKRMKVDKNDEENLENDIELQRLLKESHLLSTFSNANSNGGDSSSGVDLTLKSIGDSNIVYQDDEIHGKARMRTLEMRLNNLSKTNGHEDKISKLEKVPMNIRRGMVAKHVKQIKQYEQDAADGGIILSKVKKGQFRKIESTYKKDIERRIGQSIKRRDKERLAKRERGLKITTVGKSTRNGLIISKQDISRIGGTVGNKRKWNNKQTTRRR